MAITRNRLLMALLTLLLACHTCSYSLTGTWTMASPMALQTSASYPVLFKFETTADSAGKITQSMTVSFCNSRKMSYTVENNNIVFEYISSQAVRPCVGDESKNMLAALDSVFNFYISGSTLNLYGADSSKVVFVLTRVMPAAQAGINGAWQSLINPSSESSIVYINATSISTCCGAYLARYLITNNNKIAITTIINNSKCLSPDTLNAIASARNVRTKDNNNILMLYNSSYDLVFMGQHVGDIASDQSLDIYIPSATIIPPEMVGTAIDPNNIKQIVQRYLTASQQSTAELANDPRQVRQLVKELVSNLDGHANWDNVKLVSIVNQIVTNLTGEVYMDIVKMPVRDSTAAPIAKAATTQPKSEQKKKIPCENIKADASVDIPNLAVAAPSTIGNNAVTPNTNAGLQTVTPEHPLILRATYISDGTISSGVLLNSVSANLKTAPLASLKAIFNPSLLQGKWVPIFDSLWSDVSSLKTYTLSLTKNSLLLAGGCNEYRSSYATTGNNIVFSKVVHGVAQCTTNHDSYLSQAIFKLTKFVQAETKELKFYDSAMTNVMTFAKI